MASTSRSDPGRAGSAALPETGEVQLIAALVTARLSVNRPADGARWGGSVIEVGRDDPLIADARGVL